MSIIKFGVKIPASSAQTKLVMPIATFGIILKELLKTIKSII